MDDRVCRQTLYATPEHTHTCSGVHDDAFSESPDHLCHCGNWFWFYEARDTRGVKDFMQMMGQTMRERPTADITDEERLLRAQLVLEEALEFVWAMGCKVDEECNVSLDPLSQMDLVEAADALADSIYVVKGSALTLGIDIDLVTAEVQRSNMSKLGEDGEPVYNIPGQPTKVGKGPDYSPPDIRRVLRTQGWDPDREEGPA